METIQDKLDKISFKNEQWKELQFDKGYFVSNMGRIVSTLHMQYKKKGILYEIKGKTILNSIPVLRIIAYHFIPNPENLQCVYQINNFIDDKSVSNIIRRDPIPGPYGDNINYFKEKRKYYGSIFE
ncbi:hypothetical protein ABPG72_018578 [Tetrahymena utriculariae]